MNKFYLFIFIIFLGCSNSHRVYICGDHPCKNKKEINDYFKNNISIEVYVVESERGNRDLVEMNLIKEKGVENRKDKDFAFLKKRKEKPIKTQKKQKPSKLKLKVENNKSKKTKQVENDKKLNLSKKTFTYKKSKSTKIVHLCKSIKECDIDVISKKINDLGKDKSFPNITFGKQ